MVRQFTQSNNENKLCKMVSFWKICHENLGTRQVCKECDYFDYMGVFELIVKAYIIPAIKM